MSKSLFIVGEFGGNDYNAALFGGKGIAEARSYVPQVVDTIASGVEVRTRVRRPSLVLDAEHTRDLALQRMNEHTYVQTLIELGATEVVVPGVLPIGCFPVYLTL